MRIWFDVNRYELKNYPLGNQIGNKKAARRRLTY